MAFGSVGTLGTALSSANNQATLVLTTSAAAEVGRLVVVAVAVDNDQTGDGDSTAVASITDSVGGNVWTRAKGFANGQGSNQAGADISIWYSVINNAIPNGGTITATFTNATLADATAMSAWEFSKASDANIAIEGTPGGLANDAANAGSLDVTTANIECLRFRAIASESNSSTALVATASPAFTLIDQAISGGGTSATEMGVRGEFIISTGTGAASAPTGGAGAVDHASAYVAFKEVLVPHASWSAQAGQVTRRAGIATAVAAASGLFFVAPVAVEAPPAATTGVGVTFAAGMPGPPSRLQRLQYQAYARPVEFGGAPEDVTLDKWYRPLSEPVRVRVSINPALQQATAYVAAAPFEETVSIDRWLRPLSEPSVKARPGVLPGQQQFFVFAQPEDVTVAKWLQPFSEPRRSRQSIQPAAQQALAFVKADPFPETVSFDRWAQPLDLPPKRKPSVSAGQQQFFVFAQPEDVTVAKWLQPFSEPQRSRQSIRPAAQQALAFVKADPFPESVTLDRWLQPISQPTYAKRRVQPDAVYYGFTEVVHPNKWYQALSEPRWPRRGLAAHHQQYAAFVGFSPFAERVSFDKWAQPLSQPTYAKRRVQPDAFTPSPYPLPSSEAITPDKWYAALSEPVRFRRNLPVYQQQFAAYVGAAPFGEQVSAAGFLRPLSEPLFRRGLATAQQLAICYVAVESVTVAGFVQPLSQPFPAARRLPPGHDGSGFVFVPAPAPEPETSLPGGGDRRKLVLEDEPSEKRRAPPPKRKKPKPPVAQAAPVSEPVPLPPQPVPLPPAAEIAAFALKEQLASPPPQAAAPLPPNFAHLTHPDPLGLEQEIKDAEDAADVMAAIQALYDSGVI